MDKLPKISIVTPSFNQGQFIEQTICSVLEQNYPNLEYIIIDGGSTDQTIDIIKKYEKHITYWKSEKDRGQSDAINKGMKMATGEIVNWLNSDDYYMPEALHHVASVFNNPHITAYCGRSRVFSNTNEYLSQGTDLYPGNLAKNIGWARIDQPETFFRKEVWDRIGFINESFHYVMDKELWIRYLLNYDLDGIFKDDQVLVNFRIHENSKTGSQQKKFKEETIDLFYSLASNLDIPIANTFTTIGTTKHKPLFGYDTSKKELITKAANYYLFYLFLEAYAQNDYKLAKGLFPFINQDGLNKEDIVELKKVMLRIKLLPIPVKKFLNSMQR